MRASFLLFTALLLESKLVLGLLLREQWPRLGDVVSQELLDEVLLDNDLLDQKLSLGLFVRGVAGPEGPPGPKGAPGKSGPVGPPGAMGTKGYTGRRGPPGSLGLTGLAGVPGLQGSKGSAGPMGLPGQVGRPGYPGYAPSYTLQMNVTVLCEGNRAWLQCQPGQHVKITHAFWGRDDFQTCADHPSPNMTSYQLAADVDSDHVVKILREQCMSRHRCEAQAERSVFLDQNAPQVSKYLKVWHECIPDQPGVLEYVYRSKRDSDLNRREFYLPQTESSPGERVTRAGGLGPSKNASSRASGFAVWDKSNQQMAASRHNTKREDIIHDGDVALENILDQLLGRKPVKK